MISILEYCSKSKFINDGCVSVVRFSVDSKEIANMHYKQFETKIVFKRSGILSDVAKSVQLQFDEVERLKPLQTKRGAIFTFIMDLHDDDHFDSVKRELRDAIMGGTLVQVKFNTCTYCI